MTSKFYHLPKGHISGYEPEILNKIALPRSVHVHGYPGRGLSKSPYSAKSKTLGKTGERLFARALKKDGFHTKVESFWSVKVPKDSFTGKGSKAMKSDIDCILIIGKLLILIDVKYYTSGKGIWRYTNKAKTKIGFFDKSNGNQIGRDRELSENMKQAVPKFRGRFPSYSVLPIVVFMPTSRGEAQLQRGLKWPGGAKAVYYSEFRDILNNLLDKYGPVRYTVSKADIRTLEKFISR